jgi:hypothetical protein
MSCGLAPSYSVWTVIMGKEISGKRSMARFEKAMRPKRMIAMANM